MGGNGESESASVVGGYEVLGRVGSGSTATVFKARDKGLGRDVALKRVPASAVDLLRGEASRLAQLDDAHVVSVYGFVEEADAAYLVLEWVDGATLAEVLASGGRLDVTQALGVARGALIGLAHAHSRGVVHGDVSASNVLVDVGGTSRVIDFGVGGSTPAYRAPEAHTPDAVLTPAADVYAAAAVLTHLLTGQTTPDAVPDLSKVDGAIRSVLSQALAEAPADRFAEAGVFLAALEEAASERFGTSWWTTAGVGALVAPAVAGLVGVTGALSGGLGAAAGSAAPAAKGGAFWTSKGFVAGVTSVGVVSAVVVAAVALNRSDDPDRPTAAEFCAAVQAFDPDDGRDYDAFVEGRDRILDLGVPSSLDGAALDAHELVIGISEDIGSEAEFRQLQEEGHDYTEQEDRWVEAYVQWLVENCDEYDGLSGSEAGASTGESPPAESSVDAVDGPDGSSQPTVAEFCAAWAPHLESSKLEDIVTARPDLLELGVPAELPSDAGAGRDAMLREATEDNLSNGRNFSDTLTNDMDVVGAFYTWVDDNCGP